MFADDLAGVAGQAAEHHPAAIAVDTCQRIERYTVGACDCDAPTRLDGVDAVVRLAEVAAGLHSAVLGEDEVFGQVRSAVKDAPGRLRPFGEMAIASARQLRREATLDAHSGHLLDRAMKRTVIEAEGRLLVIGTGRMGKLVALRGRELGFREVVVAGRSIPESGWIEANGCSYVELSTMRELAPVAVAVGCLGSAAGTFDAAHDLPLVERMLLDLGTPRNFRGESGVPLLTIAQLLAEDEDLRHGRRRRGELKARLREIVEERVANAERDAGSAVGELRLHAERIRRRESARIQRLHPELDEAAIEAITRSLVNQLFHLPSRRLQAFGDPELAARVVDLFREDDEGRA